MITSPENTWERRHPCLPFDRKVALLALSWQPEMAVISGNQWLARTLALPISSAGVRRTEDEQPSFAHFAGWQPFLSAMVSLKSASASIEVALLAIHDHDWN
jgi:hypothetical protein